MECQKLMSKLSNIRALNNLMTCVIKERHFIGHGGYIRCFWHLNEAKGNRLQV